MTPLDVTMFLLQSAHQIVDWHGVRAAEQMLVNALHSHPELPWKIAVNGLFDGDAKYIWAKRVLDVNTRMNDGSPL